MHLSRRIFLADEELGKKDDDHFRKPAQLRRPSLASCRLPRRRRFFVIIGIILCCLLLSHSLFRSLSGENDDSTGDTVDNGFYPTRNGIMRPNGPPNASDGKQSSHYFNGPIRFYSLARSLYSVHGFMRYRRQNKLVLFAAANLKCISDLLPLACEMSGHELNQVHIALMGRDELSIEGIQEVNGYNESECPLIWHDARPDYGPWSTDARMEASVKSGLVHMLKILHPRAIITHESRDEPFLVRGVKTRASQTGIAHIGLKGRASSFKWITKLDSRALAAWNRAQIEILVHAPPASSGSLLRLLKSLQKADYFGPAPGLTIELPFDVDPALTDFLGRFTWPPHTEGRQFTLRRRITRNTAAEEAAIRSIDAFYPRKPWYSHVLVLSPHAELAPSFYHFLKYSILKYKYSIMEARAAYQLLGISLELPSFKPTDGTEFSPPYMETVSLAEHSHTLPVFLWQAPNSNAALYFGDKWIEFHSFLSNRFAPSLKTKQTTRPKSVLNRYPSWMEYMLEFIRARGYYLLYPAFAAEDGFSLATVHNELFQIPEEHASTEEAEPPELSQNEIHDPQATLIDDSSYDPRFESAEKAVSESLSMSNLLSAFPGHLPRLSSLSILSPSGAKNGPDDLINSTESYLKSFRLEVGGCDSEHDPPDLVPLSTNDLFCLEDDEK
ncbi:hypothetical protein CISG_01809 [Coccidioides immitis RMSCC 3703]|uniref:Glycosyltransferase 2 n=2 Tax=Coccidioides immitis TaxID=5501 RepID=A0A0J8R0U5_COCIT|nr:hypothetical protein CIRG_08457 [Coccidioides immitis RMSCC 2394]KMU78769.1 hypothetical protein CISG_01809 [Coccidioides immitis RMSCC 3703]